MNKISAEKVGSEVWIYWNDKIVLNIDVFEDSSHNSPHLFLEPCSGCIICESEDKESWTHELLK